MPSQLLPTPPTDDEKALYVVRHISILTASSVVGYICLIFSQVGCVLADWRAYALVPFFLLTDIFLFTALIVNYVGRDLDLEKHRRLIAEWRPIRYPDVDILLPVCGEPVDVLCNTWIHAAKLIDEYPGTARAYVLDDAPNEATKALSAVFGFWYGSRPDLGHMRKSGNLNYGLQHSRGEFILLLDADFACRPDFLAETLPYFDAEPGLGILQTPQFFRLDSAQNWLERGAGAIQELFYRAIQTARQGVGAAICCGTCAIYRRQALEENGGFTLIDHSEDLHTGFDLNQSGWSLHYLPIALSTGLCPTDVATFYNQQYRWCGATLSLVGTRAFWKSRLGIAPWLCHFSSYLYYIYSALFALIFPLIPIIFLTITPEHVKWFYYLLFAPSFIYIGVIFPLWHRCFYWWETRPVRIICAWAHAFALWDLFRKHRAEWHATGSTKTKHRVQPRLRRGLLFWSGGAAATWTVLSLWRMATWSPVDFSPLFVTGFLFSTVIIQVLVTLDGGGVKFGPFSGTPEERPAK